MKAISDDIAGVLILKARIVSFRQSSENLKLETLNLNSN